MFLCGLRTPDDVALAGRQRWQERLPYMLHEAPGGRSFMRIKFANNQASPGRFSAVPRVEGGTPIGFELRDVAPGSLPARLGLRSGDLLLAFAGEALTSANSLLAAYVSTSGPGPWTLTLRRGGQRLTVTYERLRSP